MDIFLANKYKDRDPYETIRIAKDFLLKRDIMVWEMWKYDRVELYTVRLQIDNTNLGANGKGTNKIFALASAYGELMERMQNLANFRRTNFFQTDPHVYFNQSLEPIASYPQLVSRLQQLMPDAARVHMDTDVLAELSAQRCGGDTMRCMVFKEHGTGETFIIPSDVLHYYYGSNGMVAGNSREEALVQGFSEVLERYAIMQCYMNRLTPPPIDPKLLATLQNYQDIQNWIGRIEASGQYKVDLVDLSLGRAIPAVGLILYDCVHSSYFVKAGVHPCLEIAVERCFTELMQGKLIDNYTGMIAFSDSIAMIEDQDNILRYYKNGQGAFPPSFFMDKPSWQPSLVYRTYQSNREMSEHLTELIDSLGYRVLIHDCALSDIPAYHIVVPGMSEIVSSHDKQLPQFVRRFVVNDLIMRGADSLNASEADYMLNYIESKNMDPNSTVAELLQTHAFDSPNVYKDTPINIFKFRLNLLLKRYGAAIENLNAYASVLKAQSKKSLFFDCYLSYLVLLENGMRRQQVMDILSTFYRSQTIERVDEDFHRNPLREFEAIQCDYHCDACRWTDTCLTKNAKHVYDQFTKRMADIAPVLHS